MLQHAVALLLQRLLGKFVSFDSSMLRLSLWQGDLAFQDLRLRLPYGEGTIGHFSVNIPWRALWTQPVIIRASRIRVLLHQSAPEEAQQAAAFAADDVDVSVDGVDAHAGDDRTYLSRLVTHIISNVQIELEDVQVRYDCMETSLAPRPGSCTLDIGAVSLINTNAEWELEFTPQSNSIMESRKLLKTERVTAYIEYADRSSPNDLQRKYLFHEWFSTVKTSLFYHSANAAFPDVELDVDVGCTPGNFYESCDICKMEATLFGDREIHNPVQPSIHFGPEHVDVLYAMLMEVKAPYDEYDRLAALSWQQPSRSDGFLMVLAYAKQWLLADLDSVVGNAIVVSDEDSDDDDEFEDAITPPSLSVRGHLRHGLKIIFTERQESEKPSSTPASWLWILGTSSGSVKQSCVEDEMRVEIHSIRMYEKGRNGEGSYSLIQDIGTAKTVGTDPSTTPVVSITCVIPAFQSRLVGHQPALKVAIDKAIVISIKDETVVKWMVLLTPVYDWWNAWNASHPSVIATPDVTPTIAPISQLSVSIQSLCFLFSVHDGFCFGSTLEDFTVSTTDSSNDTIQSVFRSTMVRFFSSATKLEALQRMLYSRQPLHEHNILVVEGGVLSKSSHSRTRWSMDSYACCHSSSSTENHVNGKHLGFVGDVHEDEVAMYNYKLNLPSIHLDLMIEEMETLAWVLGKWSFFLPDPKPPPVRASESIKTELSERAVCRSKWLMKIPSLQATLQDSRSPQSKFVLTAENCEWRANLCSIGSYQRVSTASIVLTADNEPFIELFGNQRLETPAVCVNYEMFSQEDPKSHLVKQVAEASIFSEKISLRVFLPRIETLVLWLGRCNESFELGYMLSTGYGYDLNAFQNNMSKLSVQTNSRKLVEEALEMKVNARIAQGLELVIIHPDQTRPRSGKIDNHGEQTEVGRFETSTVLLDICLGGKLPPGQIELKGSVRNLLVTDLTFPNVMPSSESVMPNRRCVGAPQGILEMASDIAALGGSNNTVDFVVTYTKANPSVQVGTTVQDHIAARVRLESVCIAYLHRVYKQFHHYVADHVVELFLANTGESRSISSTLAESVCKQYAIDMSRLPVPIDEVVAEYLRSVQKSGTLSQATPALHVELVANDLTLALPRNSFSQESIVLHCTNARFWSSGIDPSASEFLETGVFPDEGRVSSGLLSEAHVAKAQQSRRVELRNMKRQIKNQRARILSNRSQLFIDLKNATQQAQNYLHEGFESLPAAEDAVKIIHGKIMQLDQQLEDLNNYLTKVEDAIEVARAEGEAFNHGGRDSYVFLSSAPTSTRASMMRARSGSIDRIRDAVAGMSQHLIAPLFGSEDAEFHDARTASDATMLLGFEREEDLSTSSVGIFEFELVDLSGMTTNSVAPLFHHSLLTGRIDWEPESLSETMLSTYLNITLSLNELSIGASPEQYVTLLGMIYENFKELSFIVDEDTYPLCSRCGGHHYENEFCHAIWLQVPVRVGDAALRISTEDHSIVDMFCEQLELMFTMRTDDSLEFSTTGLSFTAIDVRPMRSETASEIIRPIPGDGLQVQYKQTSTWTEVVYDLKIFNTNWLVVYPAFEEAVRFFMSPILSEGEFLDFDVGFMPPAPPDWAKLDFQLTTHGCLFSLLEDFGKTDSRALVMLTDISASYSMSQASDGLPDISKWHIEVDQNGIYFSQLPDLQIDVSFPLANPFTLVVDHFIEGSHALNRRNSFVLAPVETRFSVQDFYLFINIVDNYLKWIPTSSKKKRNQGGTPRAHRSGSVVSPAPPPLAPTPAYVADKLLGDVGEVRLVLVNNSLGIPIADFQLREIVCEYIQDEDCSTTVGGTLSFNYFNNSIYRWEPLIEPFVVQMRIHRALRENSRVEVFANLPNTVNFNLTPAMAPLLSSDALKQADFVTTGSKSTAPFWVQNKTGMELKFSFRRGKGNLIQQVVSDNGKIAVDCREKGDMRSFDSTSADRFIRDADRNALTVNHTLSVWLNGNKWVSVNPVVVDIVGHVAVPLREAQSTVAPPSAADDLDPVVEEDLSPPTLVAEISIQADGSKLISLHSQVVLQNRTSVPLMVWVFSPREGGCVREWMMDREQVCHVPLELIHPQSKISVRPSPYVQYAPLATSLEELGDEVRVVKSVNTKRFIRSGECVCNFETFSTIEELKSAADALANVSGSASAVPLSGFVVRDLPTWKSTYDVEAYYLMRATYSYTEEPIAPPFGDESTETLSQVDEDEMENVEDDFLHVFSEQNRQRKVNHPLNDVNYELDEVRNANQRRGLYEATNSSLFHISVAPYLTLHNRLPTAMAYRLLNGSLQLIAEGILAVGNVVPLFQIESSGVLYVSFRLENYNWSEPRLIINPKNSGYTVPYKESIEPVHILGRQFDRVVPGEQSTVPNLQLQVKLSGRDVIVFCSVWIVNHSNLDLEYCSSASSSTRRLESIPRYVHRRNNGDLEEKMPFSTRNMSFHLDSARESALTRLQKVKAASNPVALILVIREARELYNAQYFGAQSPYVRASLYALKNPEDRYLDKPEMRIVCSATTKPSPSGGLNPKWDARLQNTLLLRFPEDMKTLALARVIIEVRNVRYGMDTCLGVTAIKVESILKDPRNAASFNWYKLLKRKSSRQRKASQDAAASVHRGDINMSFSVGTSQELRSELEGAASGDELEGSYSSPNGANPPPPLSPADSEDFDIHEVEESTVLESETPGSLPSSGVVRSMHRMQTPGSEGDLLAAAGIVSANSTRSRPGFAVTSGLDSTRSQDMFSYDPTSTRALGATALVGRTSPGAKAYTGKSRPLQVYLPHNRFACVLIEVYAGMLMSEVFEQVCIKCGFFGVLDVEDFDFYELALPRFVSLRSAGRPEGERWYGQMIPMSSKLEKRGRAHGLHLCHKMTMTTIRLYDEQSTASSHHMTPRSLVSSSMRTNPAQRRPMAWGDVLAYSKGGKNWDVLRIKSDASPWSDVIRLNRNAMGNSGVAQVISLTNEVFSQEEGSELRKGSQEIALWSSYGTGRFSETIVATIVPRYVLINRTQDIIKYRQVNVPQTYKLEANALVPFHWPSASREKLLEVTMLHRYSWSGSFRINSLGTTYLKLRDSDDPSQVYILQCQIEMVGGSIALVFREESRRFPPYRIDNMTSFRIQYKQSNWGGDKNYDELLPRSSCPYSWDKLSGSEKVSSSSNQDLAYASSSSSASRALQVRFMRVTSSTSKDGDSEKDAVEIREYNLDEMATHKRIQLHRSLPSELFLKPEQKGYLLKKDSLLKWNKKYFRLYEHMLYYFANDTDQELLGVIDLRSGSDVPGAGNVAIFEKAAEAPSKTGFISLNGLVSSLFGGSSRQLGAGDDDDEEDEDERTREVVRLAVSMTASSVLGEKSEQFVSNHFDESGHNNSQPVLQRKGFYVNGNDLVDFLMSEAPGGMSKAQAFSTAQEMLTLGVLKSLPPSLAGGAVKALPSLSFQCSASVWYSVDSFNMGDDTDSMESEDDTYRTSEVMSMTDFSVSTRSKPPSDRPQQKTPGSTQFSIVTATKCYDLKAKNPKAAKIWVRRLRMAARNHMRSENQETEDEHELTSANAPPKSSRVLVRDTGSSQGPMIVQNAKTYVHVRVRADGPTKVLELFEGGEEDFDEKESKLELASSASTSSSPTASETSTNPADSLNTGLGLHLRIDGFGISCVNELPMELVYLYFGGISVHYSRVNSKMRLKMTLDDVQIDNQTSEATFSKLLCPRVQSSSAGANLAPRKQSRSDLEEDLAAMVGEVVGSNASVSELEDGTTTGLVGDQNLFVCADCKFRQANVAAMHFCCTWSNEQGSTDYFEHCSFWLYPVITQLDEELVVSARAFLNAMSQSYSQHKSQKRGGEIQMKSIPIETMTEALVEFKENTQGDELDPLKSLIVYTSTSNNDVRKVYFALLHVHPIEFDITYRSDVLQARSTLLLRQAANFKSGVGSQASSKFHQQFSRASSNSIHGDDAYRRTASLPASLGSSKMVVNGGDDGSQSTTAGTWAIPSLAMHVPDLDNAPVRLNALMIEHAFGTSGDLTRRVSKYYTRQLWKQLHKILGSFDFLGNPVGFLDHIGTGVRDFVYEPLEGLKVGGKGFSKGLAKGTASLVSNTLDGTFDAASKISGTFGQGLATMSMDDHYQQIRARARRRHVRGIREGIVQGSKELSLGVYEGVTGLVLGPVRGAQENGAVGFVKGTITGIIGLPVKPVAGIFDFASRASQGVRNRSLNHGQYMRRVRRPRVFGRYNELKCYKEADAIAYDLLKKTGGARLSGEKIVFYNEVLQSVAASELTKEARDRRRKKTDSCRERTDSLRRSLQENDEKRADLEDIGRRKLVYDVLFFEKKLGMDLETDFYCENVSIKAFDERARAHTTVKTKLLPGQQVLQEGDCIVGIGGVDVRGIGFHETLALLRGTARPIRITFESADELVQMDKDHSDDDDDVNSMPSATPQSVIDTIDSASDVSKLKVQLNHWLIVTEERVLYINVGSFANPVVEWMTPLRYIYRVEWSRGSRICLHLSVGVDSLPTGPRLRPSLKALDSHERDMSVFLDVMWHSFGSATAEEQELWPSDTSLNGFMLKKGGFTTVKRWFVLSRNCLYYFSSRKNLRGIIPLGNVRLETDASPSVLSIRITNAARHQPLVTLQLDGGQVLERVQSEIVLVAPSPHEFEMWQSSLAHAAGKGMRHSRGTRFFVPTAASRLEIGCRDTPDFVVAPLAEALKKTVEVFNSTALTRIA